MSQIKSVKEIEQQLFKAQTWAFMDATDVSGLTYEQGVEAALRWVLGDDDVEPIENEYDSE
jgi:hypothetical protein